MSEQFILQAA